MKLQLSDPMTKRYPQLLNAKDWPKIFSFSFIEPGLVSYENEGMGKCYIDKPALDKIAPTFIGKPIVDAKDHVDGMTPADLEKVAKGYITKVYYKDGWYWADALVFDDKTRKDMENGKNSVSCAYEVTAADDKGGIRNNINYEQEVLDGSGTHIAIVPNPRYNGARILLNSALNSIGGNMANAKKIKGWFKNMLGLTAKNEISPDDTVDIDGEKVSVGELIKTTEAEQAEEAVKAAAPKEQEVNPDSVIQIGGKEVTLQNAVDTWKKRNGKKNADSAKDEADKKKEAEEKKNAEELEIETKKKQKEEDEKKNADAEELKKKEDEKKNAEAEEAKKLEEKKNADEAEEKKKEEDKKNAEAEEEKKAKELKNSGHFLSLKNAAEQRVILTGPAVQVIEDKRAKGVSCYGKK